MKKISLILALLFCVICFAGCNNYDEVRDAMRGKWGYSFPSIVGTGYCTLEFTDNTVEYTLWYTKSDNYYNHKGTYEIKEDEIIITYKDDDEVDKIDYSYNNGKLRMFYRGSDGSSNEELKLVD